MTPRTDDAPRGYRRNGHSPYGLDPRDDTRALAIDTQIRHYPDNTNHRESGATSSRRGGAKRSRRSQLPIHAHVSAVRTLSLA
jgi:hypothetical protein